MSNEFDTLRNVLSQRALQIAFDLGLGDLIKMPNTDFTEPNLRSPAVDSPWLAFSYTTGHTGQAELGGPAALEITVGMVQFDVLVAEQAGDGPALALANQIKKKINRKQWLVPPNSYVSMQAANIVNGLPVGSSGWYRCCCDCAFIFHHRDPDADPLQDFS